VDNEFLQTLRPAVKQQCMFAKFGDGRWYAILPSMETALRNAGAEVCLIPINGGNEEMTID